MTDPAPVGEPETLQELTVRRLIELGDLSAREASRHSNGGVSYETMRKIVRGLHKGNLSPRVAEGIAVALRVPIERVNAAAGVPSVGGRPWAWPEKFVRLTPAQRVVVESVAAAVLDAYEAGRRDARGESHDH